MNYFGLFFSFMLPGLILGGMAVAAVHQEQRRRRRQNARRARRGGSAARAALKPVANRNKLYVHDMNAAA